MVSRRRAAVSPEQCAEVLRAIGDKTRLRILSLLLRQGERCVSDIAEALAAEEYTVSRSLGILRAAGLVDRQRDGHRMCYRIHPDVAGHLEGSTASIDLGCCELTLDKLKG